MTKTAETLKIELAQLPVQDRAELAYFLIHSLDESVDDNIFNAWDRELQPFSIKQTTKILS